MPLGGDTSGRRGLCARNVRWRIPGSDRDFRSRGRRAMEATGPEHRWGPGVRWAATGRDLCGPASVHRWQAEFGIRDRVGAAAPGATDRARLTEPHEAI